MTHRIPFVCFFLIVIMLQSACTVVRPVTETNPSSNELVRLRKNQQSLAIRLEQMQDKVRQLENRILQQQALIDDLRRAMAPKKGTPEREITTSAPVAAPAVKPPEAAAKQDIPPEEIYRKAFSDYAAGRFPQAVAGFGKFLQNYPDNEYAGHAQYWLGECFYAQQQYERAVEAFQKTVERYPEAGKAPEALLKMAAALNQLGQVEYAEKALQILRSRYPDSAAALRSQETN